MLILFHLKYPALTYYIHVSVAGGIELLATRKRTESRENQRVLRNGEAGESRRAADAGHMKAGVYVAVDIKMFGVRVAIVRYKKREC